MPKEEPENLEKLRLLGHLAGEDVRDVVVLARQAERPVWSKLTQTGQIRNGQAQVLAQLDELGDPAARGQYLQQDRSRIDAIMEALETIDADSNAIWFIGEMLTDMCKVDTWMWEIFSKHTHQKTRQSMHDVVYKSLERNWQESVTNDVLAYFLCGLQCHEPALPDGRNLCKIIVDPRMLRLSSAGRLAAVSQLLRDNSLRRDLFHSSTCRGMIAQGFNSRDLKSMYFATMCFWMMTLDPKIYAPDGPLFEHRTILEAFCDMFCQIKKEKVVRVACYAIKALVQMEWIFEVFFHKKLDHTLTILEYEKWRDRELYDNIQDLIKIFYNKAILYSNFNRYMKELDSGKLQPGPLHTEKFWRENVKNCEENEFSPVKKLSTLLMTSTDNQTLALAAFDLGEFCRLHPTGRQILVKFGAKEQLVKLLAHHSKDVAREALLATQKFMLGDWRKVGGEAQDKHQKSQAA